VDVAIIGGGITGLTTAHQLKKAGLKVAVLEQHQVAGGETGHTTAHLTQAFDSGLETLVDNFGKRGARMVWDAGRSAIAHIAETIQVEQIDCHFRRVPGYLYAASEADVSRVQREVELALGLGYDAELAQDPGFPPMQLPAMVLPNQAQFNPRLYLLPIARLIDGDGSFVFEHTHVNKIEETRLEAGGYVVTADHIVFATHQPIQDLTFVAKLAAYQTYAVAYEVPEGSFPYILAWDTQDPYHYWRQESASGCDIVIVGGEDHRTGQEDNTSARYHALEHYANSRLARVKHKLTHRWSGQVLSSMDGAPFIGRLKGNHYVATGYGGNGLTMGTYAGLLLTDLILGRDVEAAKVFDPNRFKLVAGGVTFIEENLAFPTYLVADRLGPVDQATLESLEPGEGRVIELEGEQVAASKDADGAVQAVTAICPHMGCVVHWNRAEASWDCPCHGSRFMPDGKVINGPALEGLKPARACQKIEKQP
jgi:glycine/D-amino acid oxidase-like deaminating enzyme/nitrite reductase/ring-hydroxylating ferredoxin subunit